MEFCRRFRGHKVLIPGISGRIGIGLGHYLAKHGNEVHGLGWCGSEPTRRFLKDSGIVVHVRDLSKPGVLDGLADDFDYVFNMSVYWGHEARTSYPMWRTAVRVNAHFPADLVAKYADCKAVVLGSTGGVYQEGLTEKDRRSEGKDVPEGGIGSNIYENSKLIMEDLAHWAAGRFGVRVAILRYFWPDTPYLCRLDMATMPLFSALNGTPSRSSDGVGRA